MGAACAPPALTVLSEPQAMNTWMALLGSEAAAS